MIRVRVEEWFGARVRLRVRARFRVRVRVGVRVSDLLALPFVITQQHHEPVERVGLGLVIGLGGKI